MDIPEVLIRELKDLKRPAIIAVSGFGGSGKSSIAKSLSDLFKTLAVSVDSFQKDGAFENSYELWEIMVFSRLEQEVLIPFLQNKQVIEYGHFDPRIRSIAEIRRLKNSGLLVVEGVGLFRPELLKYFAYKIWIDCPLDIAIDRGKIRDREEYNSPTDEFWDGIWKENDLQYQKEWNPQKHADYVLPNF